ncbi:MAG: hypothetical protein QM831_21565 [Kofleriaceae bacterium]
MKLGIAVAVCVSSYAFADSPYQVLANPKATWTYDVVPKSKKKHKPTQATIAVTGVHTAGDYTIVECHATFPEPNPWPQEQWAWMIGPEGVREVWFFNTEQEGYTVEHLKSAYDDHYVPRAYLPPTLVKKTVHWKLERFGDEDRDYNVTGKVTKSHDTWHTAWTGRYSIPETGDKTTYAWSTTFDPAVGFVEMCNEEGVCLRLAK